MKTNRGIDAFYKCRVFTFVKLARIGKLPQLKYKPRKTTYKTVKRFSAKRNK